MGSMNGMSRGMVQDVQEELVFLSAGGWGGLLAHLAEEPLQSQSRT